MNVKCTYMSIVKEVGLSVIIFFFLSLQKNKMLMKQVPYNNPCNVKIVCVCVCVWRGEGVQTNTVRVHVFAICTASVN